MTFDDIAEAYWIQHPMLTNGYQSLNWTNFGALNAIGEAAYSGAHLGSWYGMVSPSNVVFNGLAIRRKSRLETRISISSPPPSPGAGAAI